MIILRITNNDREYEIKKSKYISLIFYSLLFIYFFYLLLFIYFFSFTSLHLLFLMHFSFTHLLFTFFLFISSNIIFDNVILLYSLCEASFLFHLYLIFATDQVAASSDCKNADRYCRNCRFMIYYYDKY